MRELAVKGVPVVGDDDGWMLAQNNDDIMRAQRLLDRRIKEYQKWKKHLVEKLAIDLTPDLAVETAEHDEHNYMNC